MSRWRRAPRRSSAPKNVINLMDALRRSVQGTDKSGDKGKPEKAAPEKTKKAEKGKKRAEGQREMLLPIAGKKKEAAKETAKPAARRKAG